MSGVRVPGMPFLCRPQCIPKIETRNSKVDEIFKFRFSNFGILVPGKAHYLAVLRALGR